MKNLLMKVRQEETLICIVLNMVVMVLGDMKLTQKLICIGVETRMENYLTYFMNKEGF